MNNFDIVILTFNEESHVGRIFEYLIREAFLGQVYVVDSYSIDKTVSICRHYGATVVQREFESQASSIRYFVDNLVDESRFFLRLDADEIPNPGSLGRLSDLISRAEPDCAGFSVIRDIQFMGKKLRYGGTRVRMNRIFHPQRSEIDGRLMDEHFVPLEGFHFDNSNLVITDVAEVSGSFLLEKHAKYASREIQALTEGKDISGVAGRQTYYKLPQFLRVLMLAFYRYIFLLGFLDGRAGLYFVLLNTVIYRMSVDFLLGFRRNK